ncbi:hypothetical protein ACFV4M_18780 [Kitasatospora indigofera]|uniref:hypothetical protein n=1 Tax=Kitasatospora indigofera TaxID=67307 RepID=UPI00365F16EC
MQLDGFATRHAYVPLEARVLPRVQGPGLPDVAVASASADISDNGRARHITTAFKSNPRRPSLRMAADQAPCPRVGPLLASLLLLTLEPARAASNEELVGR